MKIHAFLVILIAASLTACGTFQIGIEYTPPAPAAAAATPTVAALPIPTTVQLLPTSTPLISTATLVQPTVTPLTPEATGGPQLLKIFLVAVGDNGVSGELVGCGDSLVPVQVEVQASQGVLRASLQALLALKDQFYGQSGLYNALYQSDLQLEGVTVEAGKATINLSGTLTLGGECDNPRIAGQLEATARQFPTVNEVSILVNGKALADVLSLK